MTAETKHWQTYGVLLTGILAVSTAAILIRLAQAAAVPSVLIAAARLTIATIVLSPVVLRRYRSNLRALTRRDWLLLSVSGIFLAVHFMLWISSLEYTSVLASVVLVNTSPLWSALLEFFFLKSRLARLVILGLVLTILGSVVINIPEGALNLGRQPVTGSLMALGGAMAVAVYLVIGRKLRPTLPLAPYVWVVYGIAALLTSLIVLMTRVQVSGYAPEAYLWLLAIALIPQLIGHSSFNYALKQLTATYVGISTQMEPVFSAVLAYLLFAEVPTNWQMRGSVVVLFGVVVATLGQARQHMRAVKPEPELT